MEIIEEEPLVPVVGPALLELSGGKAPELLYPRLARELAAFWGIEGSALPPGRELRELARRYLAEGRERQNLYRDLRTILNRLEPLPVPEPLELLARIGAFDLFVTTTIDSLTERAVDQERFDSQRQTLVFSYAPNDKQDLPPEFERLKRPAVFHLMGRVSGTPQSYAVTDEDYEEFLHSLQSKSESSPRFLFDKLRQSHLLVIGTRLAGWLACHLVGGDRVKRFAERHRDALGTDVPVVLLERCGRGARAWKGDSAASFVRELYRRVSSSPVETPEPPAFLDLPRFDTNAMQPGFVFLSYASPDDEAARAIRNGLDEAGVDVVADRDDTALTPKWERKLRSLLHDAAVFVPIVSKRASGRKRRFSSREWVAAILAAREDAPSERFVLPVIVDETPPKDTVLPEALGALRSEALPCGKLTPEFIDTVVRIQRNYRSASLP